MKKRYFLQVKDRTFGRFVDVAEFDDYAEALRTLLNNIDVDKKNGYENEHRLCEVMIHLETEDGKVRSK